MQPYVEEMYQSLRRQLDELIQTKVGKRWMGTGFIFFSLVLICFVCCLSTSLVKSYQLFKGLILLIFVNCSW